MKRYTGTKGKCHEYGTSEGVANDAIATVKEYLYTHKLGLSF